MRRYIAGPAVLWALCSCYAGADFDGLGEGGDAGPTGAPSETGGEESGGSEGGDGPPAPGCAEDATPPAPTQLRRLGRAEYEATVAAALGVDASVIPPFLPDERPAGFDANFAQVDTTRAQEYQNAAVAIADAVDLEAVAGCVPSRACAQTFIEAVVPVLHRREHSPDVVAPFLAVYDENEGAGEAEAIRAVIEALLLSPHFIYHVELGEPDQQDDARLRLTRRETANRLSYFFWDAPPDAELLAADLVDPDERQRQARRLVADERAAPLLARFFVQWLGVDVSLEAKIGAVEGITPALAASMREEIERLVAATPIWSELVLAEATEVDAELAEIYASRLRPRGSGPRSIWTGGSAGGSSGCPGCSRRSRDPTRAFPFGQGRIVLNDILCINVPPPPDGAVGMAPPKDPSLTEREYSELLLEIDGCKDCHAFIEPVGWLFGNFDPLGRFTETEKGKPVNAQGEVPLAGEDVFAGPIDGFGDFVDRLAHSEDARECVVEHAFSFALGRRMLDEHDECHVQEARVALEASAESLPELLVAIAASDAFVDLAPMEAQ